MCDCRWWARWLDGDERGASRPPHAFFLFDRPRMVSLVPSAADDDGRCCTAAAARRASSTDPRLSQELPPRERHRPDCSTACGTLRLALHHLRFPPRRTTHTYYHCYSYCKNNQLLPAAVRPAAYGQHAPRLNSNQAGSIREERLSVRHKGGTKRRQSVTRHPRTVQWIMCDTCFADTASRVRNACSCSATQVFPLALSATTDQGNRRRHRRVWLNGTRHRGGRCAHWMPVQTYRSVCTNKHQRMQLPGCRPTHRNGSQARNKRVGCATKGADQAAVIPSRGLRSYFRRDKCARHMGASPPRALASRLLSGFRDV